MFNVNDLSNEITISVNLLGLHDEINKLAPNYHIVADPISWDKVRYPISYRNTLSSLSFLNLVSTQLIMPLDYAGATLDHSDYIKWKPIYFRYSEEVNLPIDFSKPIPKWGQNVLNIAIMLCLHLQASEVYLIGFDNGGVIEKMTETSHFYLSTEVEDEAGQVYDDHEMRRCLGVHLNQLHLLKRLAIREGMKIFTCSSSGNFRMFPYLKFDSPVIKHIYQTVTEGKKLDIAFPRSTMPTVWERILGHCYEYPELPAAHILGAGGWKTLSRGALATGVQRYAELFSGIGSPGDLVLFLKRTDEDLFAAYLGAMVAGKVPAQLSPPTHKIAADEHSRWLQHILEVTKAGIGFTDGDFLPEYLQAQEIKWLTPASISPCSSRQIDAIPVTPDGVVLAQMSSGTTGLQKAVFLTHQGVLHHMDSYGKAIGLGPGDVVLSWLPLYHDMGLIATFLMPLMAGIPLVLMDPFRWISNPKLLVDSAERFSATLTFLPNFAYQVLADKCPGRGLGGLRLFVNCSEPARSETHEHFLRAFPDVKPGSLSVCYAMAENTFAVSQTEPGVPPRKLIVGAKEVLSCGQVLQGTELKIIGADQDGVGEVAIRGAFLFNRFLDGADHLVDGYYPTGDLGLLDAGELFITGRKKDLIIVNGKNIYPQDVEHAASCCEGVYPGRTVCFGVENEATGSEDLVVLVEPRGPDSGADLLLRVSNAVERETGIRPRHIGVVPHMSLTKTSSGKVSRMRNRELFLEGRLGGARC